ncbi:MAG: glycosyltransferase family 39 protein [Chloroflexi bacterium]|nr:glycosyltransferase family 39 protein [Chloroflexota bacterium]
MLINKREVFVLLGILVGALALRLVFFTGMVRGDALNYAHAAYELSQGRTHFGEWGGTQRLGLYGPVAALYALFGPSEATTLLFPILTSLASVVLVYLIARKFGGVPAGLAAALIWAFLPLDVHLSTSLLPDVPLAALSTGAVYFLMLAQERAGRERVQMGIVSGLLLVWAVMVKPLALVTAIFFGVYMLMAAWRKWGGALSGRWTRLAPGMRSWLLGLGGALLFAAGLGYAYIQPRPFIVSLERAAVDLGDAFFTGATELDISGYLLTNSDLLVYSAPLFLVATAMLLIKARRELWLLFLWLGVMYVYYEWGSIWLNPLVYINLGRFNEARNFNFLLAPLVIMAGIYIGKGWQERFATWITPMVALLVPIVGLTIKNRLYAGETLEWLASLGLVVVAGALLSPLVFARTSTSWKSALVGAYLLVLSLAALQPALPYHAVWYVTERDRLAVARASLSFFKEKPEGEIYVGSRQAAMVLNYVSAFELGFDWGDDGVAGRIRVGEPLGDSGHAFVLLDGKTEPDIGWLLEDKIIGEQGYELSIYRAGATQ